MGSFWLIKYISQPLQGDRDQDKIVAEYTDCVIIAKSTGDSLRMSLNRQVSPNRQVLIAESTDLVNAAESTDCLAPAALGRRIGIGS